MTMGSIGVCAHFISPHVKSSGVMLISAVNVKSTSGTRHVRSRVFQMLHRSYSTTISMFGPRTGNSSFGGRRIRILGGVKHELSSYRPRH